MKAVTIIAALVLVAGGCSSAQPVVPAPLGSPAIAIWPVLNRTGEDLKVTGTSALEKYVLHSEEVGVGDVLAAEARLQLQQQGHPLIDADLVAAVSGGLPAIDAEQAAKKAHSRGLDGELLWMAIRRWQADAEFHPTRIVTALDAALVRIVDGSIVWQGKLPPRPHAAPASVTPGDASLVVARELVAELVRKLEEAKGSGLDLIRALDFARISNPPAYFVRGPLSQGGFLVRVWPPFTKGARRAAAGEFSNVAEIKQTHYQAKR